MDEESFRVLYERHARSLWAFLFRMTGDRTLTEDLLQETFYRFLRAASARESESHARNALFRIATNLARDAYRRRRIRLPFLSEARDAASMPDPAQRPQDARLDVARALAELRPRDRMMLWLAYAEGATHEEIAAALGVRVSGVKSMLARARARLAEMLGRRPSRQEP